MIFTTIEPLMSKKCMDRFYYRNLRHTQTHCSSDNVFGSRFIKKIHQLHSIQLIASVDQDIHILTEKSMALWD